MTFPTMATALPHHFLLAAFLLAATPALAEETGKEMAARQTGMASWYGPGHDGRRTASGELHQSRLPTAAHRRLPFGTLVRVTNLKSGSQVVVRINDRGPFVHGRVLDVSERAARGLGMLGDGVARVSLEVIGRAD